jgi:DNA-binding MarR family transcriptional regulator
VNCLCASTRHAARLLTRYYEEELRPANLTPAQFELLGTLSARPDLSQSDLARGLSLDQTTLSRNLKVLIGRKWVKRSPLTKDRRQVTYTLTAEGRKAWDRALPYWHRAHAHIQQTLGSEWQAVWSTLQHLIAAVSPAHFVEKR